MLTSHLLRHRSHSQRQMARTTTLFDRRRTHRQLRPVAAALPLGRHRHRRQRAHRRRIAATARAARHPLSARLPQSRDGAHQAGRHHLHMLPFSDPLQSQRNDASNCVGAAHHSHGQHQDRDRTLLHRTPHVSVRVRLLHVLGPMRRLVGAVVRVPAHRVAVVRATVLVSPVARRSVATDCAQLAWGHESTGSAVVARERGGRLYEQHNGAGAIATGSVSRGAVSAAQRGRREGVSVATAQVDARDEGAVGGWDGASTIEWRR